MLGRVFNNRYALKEKIGSGGMADVYLADDLTLNRPVAVKILHPEFARDPSYIQRFRYEAQAAANLNHPNIVGVYDWGNEGDIYYIVMEYVEGHELKELQRSQGRLGPSGRRRSPRRSRRPCSLPTGTTSYTGTSSRTTSSLPPPARSR